MSERQGWGQDRGGGGFPGQAPIFAVPEDLVRLPPAGPEPARAQRSALAGSPASPGPFGRSGCDPIPLEGLAQEKPNPGVSNPEEGGMSQPEGLDT